MRNIIIVLSLISVGALGYVFIGGENKYTGIPKATIEKLRICPDSWIENRMPGGSQEVTENRQYFIIDGERREIDEFDIDWIKENCDIKPKIVY
ncbi:MAG: hypothetical protein US68_C0014G0011 [Candidatus Shapirobacteria bacterium GW2011_GWE1_38_10]|uniref:Uncharacterized protein n=1 Tax=Candidatus Shapirobacteria bacterium GW2011_GWE1_38_10 TaxID=1618488 RepID=A0A0G0I2E6_9BACT|nr:MAG: hypothetical protein US68_C0014G0011 [Candidatus Shapirobacteria bacterium GW2011_GWE1_38_10]